MRASRDGQAVSLYLTRRGGVVAVFRPDPYEDADRVDPVERTPRGGGGHQGPQDEDDVHHKRIAEDAGDGLDR